MSFFFLAHPVYIYTHTHIYTRLTFCIPTIEFVIHFCSIFTNKCHFCVAINCIDSAIVKEFATFLASRNL